MRSLQSIYVLDGKPVHNSLADPKTDQHHRTGFPKKNADRRVVCDHAEASSRQAQPPPAFLFHSQCQTSADNSSLSCGDRRIRFGPSGPLRLRRGAGYMPRHSDRQPPFFDQFQIRCGSLNLAAKSTPQARVFRPVKRDWLSAGNSLIPRALPGSKRQIDFL